MTEEPKFVTMAVERRTQRQIAILAAVRGQKIYEVVASLVEAEWKASKQSGLVREAMLEREPEPA